MTRVVGLDLSLAATGWADVTLSTDQLTPPTVRVGRYVTKPPARKHGDPPTPLRARSTRLRGLAGNITAACAGARLVVVEGPAFSTGKESGTWDRAGLWWLVVARLTGAGIAVVEADPTSVKTYALGKGSGLGTGKDEVLAAVIRRYLPVVEVPGNNEADALVLAAMGARFCGSPIEHGELPATHLRAMKSVRWTP